MRSYYGVVSNINFSQDRNYNPIDCSTQWSAFIRDAFNNFQCAISMSSLFRKEMISLGTMNTNAFRLDSNLATCIRVVTLENPVVTIIAKKPEQRSGWFQDSSQTPSSNFRNNRIDKF